MRFHFVTISAVFLVLTVSLRSHFRTLVRKGKEESPKRHIRTGEERYKCIEFFVIVPGEPRTCGDDCLKEHRLHSYYVKRKVPAG